MRISIIDADEDNVGRIVPADPSVPSPSEDMVSTPSHNSDSDDDDRTDNESVLCLLPVVAFDSPHLDPAHRAHTLYAVRLCNTREIMIWALAFDFQPRRVVTVTSVSSSTRCHSKKSRASKGTDHPYIG
jgi:hypothetical protein